jgi:thioredoxin-related protein
MKRLMLLTMLVLAAGTACFAGSHDKKSSPTAEVADNQEIHWMNIDDVQVAMKKAPKMVWIDVYTEWCVWCKRMDKTTFTNPQVIKYMNEHFYAVKLDAEQAADIRFQGKMFVKQANERTHPFAVEMLGRNLSYPTSIFMDVQFQGKQVIPGYQDVKTMEMILKYLGEGYYKTTPFPEYQANFKPTWL